MNRRYIVAAWSAVLMTLSLTAPGVLCTITTRAIAQQPAAALAAGSPVLPDAPSAVLDQQQRQADGTPTAEGSASVSGVVLDASGATVAGAEVTLSDRTGIARRMVKSGANGEFSFTTLAAGSYLVTVQANGFGSFISEEFSITEQQVYEVRNILLRVATAKSEVTVRPTEVIAAEQIKAEEKQRVLGLVPNFYISYVPDAAPLTAKQKYSLAAHDSLDWTSFVGISASAGIEQANNSFKGYGQGAGGYAKRWVAKFADGRSSDFLSHAVFPSIFHQDPRYFYQGTGSNKSRLFHAMGSAFVARGDGGNLMPNYSYLLGDICSGALSNAYYPAANRGPGLVFTNAAVGLAGRAGAAVLQEFFSKRFTKHVPVTPGTSASGNGNP